MKLKFHPRFRRFRSRPTGRGDQRWSSWAAGVVADINSPLMSSLLWWSWKRSAGTEEEARCFAYALAAYVYTCGTFQFGFWGTRSSRYLALGVKVLNEKPLDPLRTQTDSSGPRGKSIHILPPTPFAKRGRAQIQINVQAVTGCICFRLGAISASCAHAIPRRQTSGWNSEQLKAHISLQAFVCGFDSARYHKWILSLLPLQFFTRRLILFCVSPHFFGLFFMAVA